MQPTYMTNRPSASAAFLHFWVAQHPSPSLVPYLTSKGRTGGKQVTTLAFDGRGWTANIVSAILCKSGGASAVSSAVAKKAE